MSFKELPWHFRNNKKRKQKKNKGHHPSLVIGESKDKSKFVNIGLTSSKKRGHHKNIEIFNPEDWRKKSYLRDDISEHPKEQMKEILYDYQLNPQDVEKVIKLIEK